MSDEQPKDPVLETRSPDGVGEKEFHRKRRFYELESLRLKILKEKAEVGVVWFKSIYQEVLFMLAAVGAIGGFVVKTRTQHKALVPAKEEAGLAMIKSGEVSAMVANKNISEKTGRITKGQKTTFAVPTAVPPTASTIKLPDVVPGLKIEFDNSAGFWAGWFFAMAIMIVTAVNIVKKHLKSWKEKHADHIKSD